MKFVRTSSLLDDAILPRNASLNLNNNSQVLNESQFEQWRYKASCTSQRIHDRIWNYRQPLTSVEWTKQNVFCDFDNCTIEHKMRVAFRKCVEKANCPFEFRVIHCKFLKEFQIYQRHNHCHLIQPHYIDNIRGIDEFYQSILIDYNETMKSTGENYQLYIYLW